jgi:4-hydroxybenzoate polyprenyltransferase
MTDLNLSYRDTMRGYLELLRPPNIITAVADVLAGFAVSGLGNTRALPWLLVATACLYGGGVVLNDVFDRHVDAVERPERPIPGRRVGVRNAAILGAVLLATGVVSASRANGAALTIAAATAGFVLLYDGWAKRHALAGPAVMGLCRALNLLLGIAAAPAALEASWRLAGIPFFYISGVTALSRGEVHGGRRGTAALALIFLVAALAAATAVAFGAALRTSSAAALAILVALAYRVLPPFWRAYRRPAPDTIRNAVKAGVLSLVLVDGVIAAAYGGALYAAGVLATALVAAWLARLFSVT